MLHNNIFTKVVKNANFLKKAYNAATGKKPFKCKKTKHHKVLLQTHFNYEFEL